MSIHTTNRRPVRIGTIVWGAILVAVAVFALLLARGLELSPAAALWSVIGFGALLVLAAILAGIVRATRRAPAEIPVTTAVLERTDAVAEVDETASTDRLTPDSSGAPLGDD